MTDIADVGISEMRRELYGKLTFELQSEHVDKISAALSKAQADMTNAIYNRENPHFQSKYADLAAVRRATMQHLSANGISLHQGSVPDGYGNAFLITQLTLGDQWLRDYQQLPVILDNPQKAQSFRSYARRGGWTSICGIAVAGEDDDGNIASGHGRTITASQLDELMAIVHERGLDTTLFCPGASERLGYKIENLSQVLQPDMTKVRGWLTRSRSFKQ